MTNTLGIVEVPSLQPSQSRQSETAESIVSRRLGGKPLLEWVVRRVTESLLLDQVVVVTEPSQVNAVRRNSPPDVPVFVGEQLDPLARFAAATRHYHATHVVRVPLACIFVDPELIDRLVCTAGHHPSFDYIGYFSMDGRPAVLSKVGLFAEWATAEAVERADRAATLVQDRMEPTRHIYSHPDLFQLRFIPVPEKLDRPDVRLAMDVDEDWDLAHLICDALGPDVDWHRIAALLDEHPALRQRMAVLNSAEVS